MIFPAATPRHAVVMQLAPLKFVLTEHFWPGIEAFGDITIPEGFVTDFYSTPRILWSLYPPHLMPVEAAIIHDYSYRIDQKHVGDDWFYIAMIKYGAPKRRARLFTSAVKTFGNPAKSSKRKLVSHSEIQAMKDGNTLIT